MSFEKDFGKINPQEESNEYPGELMIEIRHQLAPRLAHLYRYQEVDMFEDLGESNEAFSELEKNNIEHVLDMFRFSKPEEIAEKIDEIEHVLDLMQKHTGEKLASPRNLLMEYNIIDEPQDEEGEGFPVKVQVDDHGFEEEQRKVESERVIDEIKNAYDDNPGISGSGSEEVSFHHEKENHEFIEDESLHSAEASEGIRIRFRTFEEARQAHRIPSPELVDGVLSGHLQMSGRNFNSIKTYFDNIEMDANDREVLQNIDNIVRVHREETEMIARVLKVLARGTPEEKQAVVEAKEAYVEKLRSEAADRADKTKDWVETADLREQKVPRELYDFNDFHAGEAKDVLGSGGDGNVLSNITIQRQIGGNFIMAKSDAYIKEQVQGKENSRTKRIYLNPQFMATPEIFEKLIDELNQRGLSVKMKMLQRSFELGTAAYWKKTDAAKESSFMRGDGIVMYADDENANDVLVTAFKTADKYRNAFVGRRTSRVPQSVADGISVGEEPIQQEGEDPQSLTQSRVSLVKASGPEEEISNPTVKDREHFWEKYKETAKIMGVDVNNMAFNSLV